LKTRSRSSITAFSPPAAFVLLDVPPVRLRKTALHGIKIQPYLLPSELSDTPRLEHEPLTNLKRYEDQSDSDTAMIILNISNVVEIPGESKLGQYNYDNGEADMYE